MGVRPLRGKLRAYKPLQDACIGAVLGRLHAENPGMGENVAIDGSDLPEYANGQLTPMRRGAIAPQSFTRKGGGYCATRSCGCPHGHGAAARVGGSHREPTETTVALPLLDAVKGAVRNAIANKGCDNGPFHDGCMARAMFPVTTLRRTTAVVRGDHKPRCCERGEWRFAETDYKRQATKWRCPTGECQPKSMWVKPTGCTR